MKKLKYLLITLILACLAPASNAAGIQVSPARLDFTIIPGKTGAVQTLTIANPTADVALFDVYADDFKSIIIIAPESFTLESGGKKQINVSINRLKLKPNEALNTNISVVSKPLADSKLNLAAGAKIPVTVSYAAAKENPSRQTLIILLGAAIIAALGYSLGRAKSKPLA